MSRSKGWGLKHASYTRDESRNDRQSGSIQLNKNALAVGPKVKVKPGKVYTCGLYFKGHAAPTTFMRLSLKVLNAKGKALRNAKSASHWGYAKPNQWQEANIIFKAKSGDAYIRILATRPKESPNTASPMWIDDVYCGEGISFDQPKSSKKSFSGGLVKVAASGKMSIKQPDGKFKDEFLRCMFVDRKRDEWSLYGANGFNCNMWAASLRQVKKGVKAGLPYHFFALAPYVKGWAAGNLKDLEKSIKAIHNSPYANHLVGYYFDNESHEKFQLATQVLSLVDKLDRKNGKRQRPIYVLQGNHGSHAPYIPYVDMVGTYTGGGDTGGAGGGNWALLTLENMHGQTSPVVVAQINQGVGKGMRSHLLGAIQQGAKAMGYWRNKPVEPRPWWPDFPNIVQEALKALGMKDTGENTTPTKGSIQMHIQPEDAVRDGAQWRFSNENTWQHSGEIRSNLPFGTYTIKFKSIDNWITPRDQKVRITRDDPDRSTTSDHYVPDTPDEPSGWPPSNLLSDSTVKSSKGWKLKNAAYTKRVSRQADGSGAIELRDRAVVLAPSARVKPGKTYTCGLYFMTQSSKKTRLRLGLQARDSRGRFLYNSRAAKTWRAAASGQWRQATIVHKAQSKDHRILMLLSIPKGSAPGAKIWVDDIYCGQGTLPNVRKTVSSGPVAAARSAPVPHPLTDIVGTLINDPAIYDEGIAYGWSVDFVSDVQVDAAEDHPWRGKQHLRVVSLVDRASLHLESVNFFTGGYRALSFAVRGQPQGDNELELHVYTADQLQPIGSVDLHDYLDSGAVTDQWQEVVIPLKDLEIENTMVSDLNFQSNTAGEFHIDALEFQ